MILSQVYEKYWIPPNLQQHMRRTAAVALQIVDAWCGNKPPERDAITQTLLLHDMGKIIHFDFVNTAHFFGEESKNVEYWRQIQRDFIAKFGNDEHKAMLAIVKEVGVSDRVYGLLDAFGSTPVYYKLESDDWNLRICTYADFRTAPFGIVSVKERFEELEARYRKSGRALSDIEALERDGQHCLELEQQLRPCVKIDLSEISDESIQFCFSELMQYRVGSDSERTDEE
jgi:hypothetical protein